MKYKLQPLNHTALSHAEAGDLIARSISKMNSLPPAMDRNSNALSEKYLPGLTQRHDVYYKALNQNGTNEMTERVKNADWDRDKADSNLEKAVKLGQNSEIPAEKEAARVIGLILEKHKGIRDLSYGAETETICTLLNDLAAPALIPHIESLNLQRYIARLKATNDAFAALHDNRAIAENMAEGIKVSALRRDLLAFYKEMCLYIQSMANANDGGYYAQLLALINGTRKQYADGQSHKAKDPESVPQTN